MPEEGAWCAVCGVVAAIGSGEYTRNARVPAAATLAARGRFAHTAVMDTATRRVIVLCIAIALAAVVFAAAEPTLESVRGIPGPTVADSSRPFLAMVAILAAFAATTAVAAFIARKVNSVVALFVLGCGIGMLSMRTGAVRDLVFGESSLKLAAVECVVWTALLAAACHVIFRFGGRLPDIPETHDDDIDSPVGRSARLSWLAGIAGVVAAWFAVATLTKGQAIGAAVLGGFVSGALGRILAPRTTPVYLAAAPMAVFAVVYAFMAFTVQGDIATDLVQGGFPRLLRIMPLDMAAGALAGTSLGFGFVRSFTEPKTA